MKSLKEESINEIHEWYLLENGDIIMADNYWILHRETYGKHPPAIKESKDREVLLRLSKKMKK